MSLHTCSSPAVLPCLCVSSAEKNVEHTGLICVPSWFLILIYSVGVVTAALFTVWFTGTHGSEGDFCNERKTLEWFAISGPSANISSQPSSTPAEVGTALLSSTLYPLWWLPGSGAERNPQWSIKAGPGAMPVPLPQPGARQLGGTSCGCCAPPRGQDKPRPGQQVSLQVGSGSALQRRTRARCRLEMPWVRHGEILCQHPAN